MTNDFPTESALYPDSSQYQYSDSFAIPLQRTDIESWELIAAFFQSAPSWVDSLFVFRNRIVEHLGLKTGHYNSRDLDAPYQVGRRIGLFRVIGLTDREAIIGEDDTHLDFRTSLLLIPTNTGSQLVVSTLVKTKNTLGIAYFSVVKHFHRLFVPIMVKAMAKKIEERSLPQHRS
jgi:hypothetical protein